MITDNAKNTNTIEIAIKALTMLNDLRYPTGTKKRSHILHILRGELTRLFKGLPRLDQDQDAPGNDYRLIDFAYPQRPARPAPGMKRPW